MLTGSLTPAYFGPMPTKTEPQEDAPKNVVQVVISNFPKDLLDEIDADARRNNRTRAAEIRHTLAERIAARRQPQAA